MTKTQKIQIFLAFTLFVWHSVSALNHSNITEAQTKAKIPVTKCCQEDEIYMVGLDTCQRRQKKTKKLSDRVKVVSLGRQNAERRELAAEDFNITINKVKCPYGYVAVSTPNFTFHADGSLYSVTDELEFDPGQFCLHESLPHHRNFSARYCLLDHFINFTKVRKCCPMNMSFDGESCQFTMETFSPIYHYENGSLAFITEESLPIQDSVFPDCYGRRRQMLLSDEYYLLPDGVLYARNSSHLLREQHGRQTERYCVDFLSTTKEFNQIAVVCTAAEPKERIHPVREERKESQDEPSHSFYPYFMFVSAFFLILTSIVYILVPEMRNIHGIPVMCYVLCLAVCYIVNGVLQLVDTNITELCRVLAAVMHFLYLSTYCWLNIVCFDIWWTLRKMRVTRSINQAAKRPALGKAFIFYSAYAWLIPASFVVITQVLDNLDNLPAYIIPPVLSNQTCWFSELESVLVYVYHPVAALNVVDILLVVMTTIQLNKAGFRLLGGVSKENIRYVQRLMIIIGLFTLKMTAWISEYVFALLGYLYGDVVYVIDSIELAASVLTFVIFACKPRVWELLTNRYCKCFRRGLPSSNSKDVILEMSSTPGTQRKLVFNSSS